MTSGSITRPDVPAPARDDSRRRYALGATGLAVAALVVAVLAVLLVMRPAFIDLGVYELGGTAVRTGQPLYDLSYRDTGLRFTYPPFAALLFAPLSGLHPGWFGYAWAAVSLLALARCCRLLVRDPRLALGLFALALLTEPVLGTLRFGQVNLILLWLVLEDTIGAVPPRARGWLTGLAAGIKLTPLAFVLFAFLRGDRREAMNGAAAFAGTVLAGVLLLPADAVRYWSGLFLDADRVGGVAYAANQSVLGALSRLVPDPAGWLWLGLAGTASAAGLLVAVRCWRRGDRVTALAAAGFAALLLSPISWTHHWVWLVVAAAAALERRARWTAAVTAVGLAAAAVWITWWGPFGADRELAAPGWAKLTTDAYVLVALAWLLAALPLVVGGRGRVRPRRTGPGVPRSAWTGPPPARPASPRTRSGRRRGPLPARGR